MAPVLLLFFLSGATALGYQVLWSKYLLDFIGISAYSYAAVLSSFMAGLAIGSAVLGRWADRLKSPLRLFAAVELAIGAYAAVYPGLSTAAADLYSKLAYTDADSGGTAVGLGAKALVAGLLLLPPTILMGGTFPAMLRHVTTSVASLGSRAALLYSVNAAGSVAGALAMAFVCLPNLGMRRSLLLLAATNVAVALAAFGLAARTAGAAAAAGAAATALIEDAAASPPPATARRRLALLFAAGFVSFACEIAWTRYLGVVLGSSTYSFAIILAAFIAGIAVGSAWLSRRAAGLRAPFTLFGWTQIAAAFVILAPLPLYPYLPWLFARFARLLSPTPGAFALYETGKLLLCFIVLLLPTALMGLSLPLVLKDVAHRLATAGREAGRVYAWNTWGNVAGALLAGHLLLPRLGMEGLLRISALLCGLVGFVAVWLDLPAALAPRRRRVLRSTALLALLVALHATWSPWKGAWFALQPFRMGTSMSFAQAKAVFDSKETMLFADDPAANVLVLRQLIGGRIEYSLLTNGKADATSTADLPTQALLAHLPLLLAPRTDTVLVIGLASGITAEAVLRHDVRRLDVVELVGVMRRAALFFIPPHLFDDPRFRLIYDDARSYVSQQRRPYDIVISEPSNPWSGSGPLFTTDFYEKARRALHPDGVYVQWFQIYEMSDQTFSVAIRSFRKSFRYVYGFQGIANDVILMGAQKPLVPDWPTLERRFQRTLLRHQLREIGIEEVSTLLAMQQLSPPGVDLIAAMATLENNDDNRLLEYRTPKDLFTRSRATLVDSLDERSHAAPTLFWHQWLRLHPDAKAAEKAAQLFTDPRVGMDRIRQSFQLAAHQLEPTLLEGPSPQRTGAFPVSYWVDPPPTAEATAARLSVLLKTGHIAAAEALIRGYSSAVLIQAAVSRERGEWWLRQVEEWRRLDSRAWAPLRAWHVELLIASGHPEAAARELRAWLQERVRPQLEWTSVRACQIDEDLCAAARAAYRDNAASAAIVRRLEELPR